MSVLSTFGIFLNTIKSDVYQGVHKHQSNIYDETFWRK